MAKVNAVTPNTLDRPVVTDFSQVRLVHVVRQFHPNIGGFEDFVKNLALMQVGRFADLKIVTLDRLFVDPGKKLPKLEEIDGLQIERIPFTGSNRYPVAPGIWNAIQGADLVHVHAIDFFFDALALTKAFHRRKLVATTHGGFFHTRKFYRLKKVWFNSLTRFSASQYGGLACCSDSDMEQFRKIAPKKSRLIENGVDLAKFGDAASRQPAKQIVALGRFSNNKRLDRVLEMMAALVAKDPQWRLTIVGNPSDISLAGMKSLAYARGLSGNVEILTGQSDADIRTVLGRASFFASASVYEGFGIAMIEALSAGLLPVVHPNDAFSSLAAKHPMVSLADYGEPATAANAVQTGFQKLVEEPELREAAISSAAQHGWEAVIANYDQLYLDVLNG